MHGNQCDREDKEQVKGGELASEQARRNGLDRSCPACRRLSITGFLIHASTGSMHRAGGGLYARIELYFTKRAFVVGYVLVKDRCQRLGLLRAQINALEIAHLDLILRLLLHGAEDEKKVPDVDPNLYAVGVSLAIFRGTDDTKIWLNGIDHKGTV